MFLASPEERIKELDKKIARRKMMDYPLSFMLGLVVYTKFFSGEVSIHPIFDNELTVNILFAIVVPVFIFSMFKLISLIKERRKLQREYDA